MNNLDALYQLLRADGIDMDAIELAESLWLSKYISKTEVVTSPDKESSSPTEPKEQEEESNTPTEDTPPTPEPSRAKQLKQQKRKDAPLHPISDRENKSSLPFRTPLVKKLYRDNDLIYAFRHFRQKVLSLKESQLDEEKIADYIAKTDIFRLFYQKSYEKRFRVLFIIDSSESMKIWESLIEPFIKDVKNYHIFKEVMVYYLATEHETPKLFKKKELTSPINKRWYRNFDANSITFLFSDMLSQAWSSGELLKQIEQWQSHFPFAIVQMLPQRLWNGTKLIDASMGKMSSRKKFALNHQITSRAEEILAREEEQLPRLVKIPLLNFNERSIEAYGRVMRSLPNNRIEGALFEAEDFRGEYHPVTQKSELNAEQRLRAFYKYASREAKALLELLAVVPLSLPIVKLVQQKLLPQSTQEHLSEVFMSSIIDKEQKIDGFYQFSKQSDEEHGVRDELIKKIGAKRAFQTIVQLSEVIQQQGGVFDFLAFVVDPESLKQSDEFSEIDREFARISVALLRQMGEKYSGLADRLVEWVDEDEVAINFPPHIIPKVLTKQTGLANDIDFVGRKAELQKVDELLNQNSMLLLLNGIGGIGKSTLASYYLNQHKENFDYYGFVQVNEDIKLSLASALSTSLDLKSEKIDDLFAEIMNKLQNLEGKKLLIIDDVKEMDNQLDEINTLMTLKNSGFQILFTSREVKENIPQYFLDIMSIEDARELFLKHHATDEMDKVDKILAYLDYHTLFIEMTAKTLTKRRNTLSLDKVIERFENGEFTAIKKGRGEDFSKILKQLFSFDDLDDLEILILKQFSILPVIDISFDTLKIIFNQKEDDEFEETLLYLVEKGWFSQIDDNYKLHQIIKEYILSSHLPIFNEIETIFNYFSKLIEDSTDAQVAINNREYLVYFDSITITLTTIDVKSERVATFYDNVGNVYYHLGIYKNAKNFYFQAFKIREKLYDTNHQNMVASYNNLAGLYNSMGEYSNALPLYQKALAISEKVLGREHPSLAISYNNLAGLYYSIGEYNNALPLYQKALAISEKLLGKEHPTTATSYNNLAGLYSSIGKYKNALPLYQKALAINEKLLGKEHPTSATSYANLAGLYSSMGEFNNALAFYQKALTINEKILGKEHTSTASSYNNLAILYYQQSDYQKAYLYMEKSVSIWKKTLPKEHPTLLKAKKDLEIMSNTQAQGRDIIENNKSESINIQSAGNDEI